MSYPALIAYLARLSDPTGSPALLWLNQQGQAEGRFFNCTLTSAFQPVRDVASGALRAWEALARHAEDGAPALATGLWDRQLQAQWVPHGAQFAGTGPRG